ncbi:hypothetical protein [Magnetospirillum sp. UT-4]|uniref:hypothetical protein n=1 Tax=Magnetospirillum sp. UT-4 TaxID=2681467 RepID=UPI001382FFAF|nr:hypothetical protein [Magnetospirillum sp. UT-4]CAA7623575.1 conserved hypothetical protein [Magnetospirillum sp. UT-4]
MRAGLAILLPILVLAACGEVPKPFQHDEGTAPSLARPKMDRGVVVRPPAGLEDADSLAGTLVGALAAYDVLAVARGGPAFGHVVEAVPLPGGDALVWVLKAPDGTELASHRQRLAPAGATPLAKRFAAESASVLARPLLIDPDALPRRQEAKAGAVVQPSVRLQAPTGLPGDGDRSLAAAMRRALERQAMAVKDGDAEYLAIGTVAVSPGRGGDDTVMVAWRVRRVADGAEIANIAQEGAVPRGRLDLPWGSLARDIAEGGASGIAEAVRAAAAQGPKRFTEPGPADIRGADPSEQKTEARPVAEPPPDPGPEAIAPTAPAPAKVTSQKPPKGVGTKPAKKRIKAKAVKVKAKTSKPSAKSGGKRGAAQTNPGPKRPL